ncbi:hypothetical protein OIO90_001779 [Microbotryomycetes sp. JL221]|nr:hypothetical protein OIO90_001779 [Microbotryomycetes sp. JL221]
MSFSSLYGLVPESLRPGTPNTSTQRQQQQQPSRNVRSGASEPDDVDDQTDEQYESQDYFQQQVIPSTSRTTARQTQQATNGVSTTKRSPMTTSSSRIREAELQLSADCPHCNNEVVIKVPKYMMQAISAPAAATMGNDSDDGRYSQHHLQHGHQSQSIQVVSTRDRVVNLAVKAAVAFRESRLPALIAGFIRAAIALIVYLDQTFSIHQRLIMVFWIVLADLQRIEQEVGLLRNSGDAISVLEALVKGAIALGRPERGSAQSYHQQQPGQTRGGFSSSTSMPHLSGTSTPSGFLQPPYQYGQTQPQANMDDGVDYSAGEMSSSSDMETGSTSSRTSFLKPESSTTNNNKYNGRPTRTLRRMANSVPSFQHNDGSRPGSGSTTPNSGAVHSSSNQYFDMTSSSSTMRPRLGRQRSRSGPDEREDVSRTPTGRDTVTRSSWVASRVAGVAGAVLPGMRG